MRRHIVLVTATFALLAATPVSSAAQGVAECVAPTLEVNGESVHVIRSLGQYPVTGTYRYDGHQSGHPIIRLDADGSGVFEAHGNPYGTGTPYRIQWWVLADCDGTPVVLGENDNFIAYTLIWEYREAYAAHQVGDRRRLQISVGKSERQIRILGERVKTY